MKIEFETLLPKEGEEGGNSPDTCVFDIFKIEDDYSAHQMLRADPLRQWRLGYGVLNSWPFKPVVDAIAYRGDTLRHEMIKTSMNFYFFQGKTTMAAADYPRYRLGIGLALTVGVEDTNHALPELFGLLHDLELAMYEGPNDGHEETGT